jgi:hypothetical protein
MRVITDDIARTIVSDLHHISTAAERVAASQHLGGYGARVASGDRVAGRDPKISCRSSL